MLITELIFVPFLIVTFFVFQAARKSPHLQPLILLIASCIFYGWWDLRFLAMLLASAILNFLLGNKIHKTSNPKPKKILLITGLTLNIGVLAFFKYVNFFIQNLDELLRTFGLNAGMELLDIVVPLGISFYTFWTLSYLVDVYTGKTEPAVSLTKYLVFALCFPHIIAGPIVRAQGYISQLEGNLVDRSDHEGLFLILYGFLKKVLLADTLGRLFVNEVFQGAAAGLMEFSSVELVFVIYCYAFQIFFDFSAYSDIAIGLGKLFGIRYPVNFKYPYSSLNPPEFWRKWHITLSFWLRDYLFLPIAYSVMRRIKTPRFMKIKVERWGYMTGMLITMLLCGLWHGAAWTFVVWGGLHGVYLVVYNLLPRRFKRKKRTPKWLRMFGFFNLTALAWIFFRAPSVEYGLAYLKQIFSFSWGFDHFPVWIALLSAVLSVAVHALAEPNLDKLAKLFNRLHWSLHAGIVYAVFLLMAHLSELDIDYQAFIYFQF